MQLIGFDNVGIVDTAVRSVIAIVLLALAAEGIYPLVMLTLGAILWMTSAFGWCPLYRLLGIDTFNHNKHA